MSFLLDCSPYSKSLQGASTFKLDGAVLNSHVNSCARLVAEGCRFVGTVLVRPFSLEVLRYLLESHASVCFPVSGRNLRGGWSSSADVLQA